jgi:hypothetical protein
MTMTDPIRIPLSCPKCGRDQIHLLAESASVVTLRCDGCFHAWSAETALPSRLRERLRDDRAA